jgi:hypothetical protein
MQNLRDLRFWADQRTYHQIVKYSKDFKLDT